MLFRESIFMTGFPGFIAGRLLERIVASETQYFLLVQPHLVGKAMEELEAIAEITDTPLESFVIVEGDITLPNLGLSDEDCETIRFEATEVYHLAAIYDLAVAKEPAFRINVDGTKNVNDFVRSIRKLKRYHYISTCYVAGRRKGVILETELEHDAGFRNFYEETKYLAEVEVEKLKGELPVTIYRPSVVVGDSRDGSTAKYDGIYYLINYLRKAPTLLRLVNVGNEEVRLNLVPVDFVVEGIAALARDKDAIGKTVALADPSPLTTAEIFDVIARDLSGRKSEFMLPRKTAEWFLWTGMSPVVTGLPHHGVPYFFLSQLYDTSVADKLLAKYGIECPRFGSYVEKLIDFVEENPTL